MQQIDPYKCIHINCIYVSSLPSFEEKSKFFFVCRGKKLCFYFCIGPIFIFWQHVGSLLLHGGFSLLAICRLLLFWNTGSRPYGLHHPEACGILVPQPGIELISPSLHPFLTPYSAYSGREVPCALSIVWLVQVIL